MSRLACCPTNAGWSFPSRGWGRREKFNSARPEFSLAAQVLCLMNRQATACLLHDSKSVTGRMLLSGERRSIIPDAAAFIDACTARDSHGNHRPPARVTLLVHTCTNAGKTRKKCHFVPLSATLNPTGRLRPSRRGHFRTTGWRQDTLAAIVQGAAWLRSGQSATSTAVDCTLSRGRNEPGRGLPTRQRARPAWRV